jgi:hypothetical protein
VTSLALLSVRQLCCLTASTAALAIKNRFATQLTTPETWPIMRYHPLWFWEFGYTLPYRCRDNSSEPFFCPAASHMFPSAGLWVRKLMYLKLRCRIQQITAVPHATVANPPRSSPARGNKPGVRARMFVNMKLGCRIQNRIPATVAITR